MTEHELEESLSGHRIRNSGLRQTLNSKGVDLTEGRPVDVHFWAWSQRDAAVLARELYKKGFLVKLLSSQSAANQEGRWGIEAGALIVPEEILGDDFTEGMVRLAANCDGVYDGWGTEGEEQSLNPEGKRGRVGRQGRQDRHKTGEIGEIGAPPTLPDFFLTLSYQIT